MHSLHQTSRRSFCRRLAIAAVLYDLAGAPWAELFNATAGAAAAPVTGTLRLSMGGYTELESVGGSLLLSVAGMPADFAPIYITRTGNSTFVSASSKCTHNGCQVNPNYFRGYLYCTCHGSRFLVDGTLVNGPAPIGLPTYATTFDGADTLAIQIPGLGYQIAGALVATTAGQRYKLVFPTIVGMNYAVAFRDSAAATPSYVKFAVTETGPASQSSIVGTGADQTVYVPAPAPQGFYAILRF